MIMQVSGADSATPAMAQWFKAKSDYSDALVFFRMGDFYELFFDDAEAASTALDIALTSRGTHRGQPIPMCGVPVSQRDAALARLVRRGFRVAIAEQLEAPETARARGSKAPIDRAVVRLITPGTITEEALLEPGSTRLLLALAAQDNRIGAAWLDASTGLFETASISVRDLPSLLGRLDPAEILSPDQIDLAGLADRRSATELPPTATTARHILARSFGVSSIEAFGAFTDEEAIAAAHAVRHIERCHGIAQVRLARPKRPLESGLLTMDAATRASLDLVHDRNGQETGSLLRTVKHTLSAAGARLLAHWIVNPLDDQTTLISRQTAWRMLSDHPMLLDELRAVLRGAADLARSLVRLGLAEDDPVARVRPVSPRDLGLVRDALEVAERAAGLLTRLGSASLPAMLTMPAIPTELHAVLRAALVATPPARSGDAESIRPGFDAELDSERQLRDESRRVVAGMQSAFARQFGVPNLKIRYHAQLGYVIEVPSSAIDTLREFPELLLRQGLASAARFSHPELVALDQRIAEAHGRAAARESWILAMLRRRVVADAERLAAVAETLAGLDVAQSAASLVTGLRWCVPQLTSDAAFEILGGRHPVVEAALPPGQSFIANDADLSPDHRLMLLTGPNMAGKSTFLRQNALMVVLAQAGLPVPADSARIGLVDRLFSRVGAADDLAAGRSTFMVEMIETASILNQAGPRSFVIIDEIGRGTGTRDGLAIAQAVLEALHGTIRCRAIFATHFHDLTVLAEALPRLSLRTMRVKEWRGEIVFLHEVIDGAAARSWGVHVAKLAGVPASVVRRAEFLLRAAERADRTAQPLPLFDATAGSSAGPDDGSRVIEALAAMDPDQMTPRDALSAIYALRRKFLGVEPANAVDDK